MIATLSPPHYDLAVKPLIQDALDRANSMGRLPEAQQFIHCLLQNPAQNYRPLPQALQFHTSTKRYRWALGGNRSSKSHSLAQEVYWFATGTHPFKDVIVPNTGWYCTITWELVGAILWDKMESLLSDTPHEVLWRNRRAGIPGRISIPVEGGESHIIFKAYEQGRQIFQGTERRYIANDEQFSQDIYTEQISRIGPGQPLDFMAAMTPIIPQPWLEERLTTNIPTNWGVFEYPLDDNRISLGGFLPDEEIDQLINEWPEEIQPTRRLGKWASYLGAVYKTFSRGIHVVPERDEHKFFPDGVVPVTLRSIGGIDWGGNNPFVFLWAVQLPHLDDEWYVYDEYYWEYRSKGVRLISQHAEEIKRRTKDRWKSALGRVWADHDAQDVMEMNACGIASTPAIKDVLAGIETIQKLLKVSPFTDRPTLHIAERCAKTITQMATLMWSEGSDTHDPVDAPVKHDDHCPDVVRYIMHSEDFGMMRNSLVELDSTYRRRF